MYKNKSYNDMCEELARTKGLPLVTGAFAVASQTVSNGGNDETEAKQRRVGKNGISVEELQKYKEMEQKAKLLRKYMPISLQYLLDDVNYENIRPKDIEIMKKKISGISILNDGSSFGDKLVNALSNNDEDYLKEISSNERDYLLQLLQGKSDGHETMFIVLKSVLDELPSSVSTANKIQLLVQAKDNYIDGALLKKKLIPEYQTLIDFAKDNKEALVEPVQPILDDSEIDIKFLAKKYIEELLKVNKIDFHNEEYDYENVYTIPTFIEQGSKWHVEKLFKLLSQNNSTEYMSFLHDQNSSIGISNNKTRQIYEKNGLNYAGWLNFDEEQQCKFFNSRLSKLSNKSMYKTSINPWETLSFRTWKRNPKFDIFQGTTASQCIALDGINGNAGIDELLYTYAQLVELYNLSQDKSVGNACMYWIKDLTGNVGLLIDSVSFKNDYANDRQLRNNLFNFARRYAQYVSGDNNVKLYIGNNFNKFDISDLPLCTNKQYQILGDTNNRDIYLDAIIAKDAASRYININEDKVFNMEIREII